MTNEFRFLSAIAAEDWNGAPAKLGGERTCRGSLDLTW